MTYFHQYDVMVKGFGIKYQCSTFRNPCLKWVVRLEEHF